MIWNNEELDISFLILSPTGQKLPDLEKTLSDTTEPHEEQTAKNEGYDYVLSWLLEQYYLQQGKNCHTWKKPSTQVCVHQ